MRGEATYNIILPVYNAEGSIQACIDSIVSQTFEDWRLLILDDGSTDKTWDMLKSYTDKRIIAWQQPNAGAYVARNNLIENVNCKFLAFIDADDTWSPTKLEKQLEVHNAGYGFVCCDAVIVSPQSSLHKATFGKINGLTGNAYSAVDLLRHRANFIIQSSVSIKFSYYKKVGPFVEERLAADFIQWLRVLALLPNKEFYYMNEVLCSYTIHENNISKDITKKFKCFENGIKKVMCEFDCETQDLIQLKIEKNKILVYAKERKIIGLLKLAIASPIVFSSVLIERLHFYLNSR